MFFFSQSIYNQLTTVGKKFEKKWFPLPSVKNISGGKQYFLKCFFWGNNIFLNGGGGVVITYNISQLCNWNMFRAKIDIVSLYSINSLVWMLLKTLGHNPQVFFIFIHFLKGLCKRNFKWLSIYRLTCPIHNCWTVTFKGTVHVILSDSPFIDWHVRFTTVEL